MILRALSLTLAAASLAVTAPAANAGPCFGSTGTTVVCVHPERLVVDPDGNGYAGDCFYVNSTSCVPVFVPVPSVSSTGPLVTRTP